jgi:hypothetical protein
MISCAHLQRPLYRAFPASRVRFDAGSASDGIKNGDRSERLPPCEHAFERLYPLLVARYAGAESHHLFQLSKVTPQPFEIVGKAAVVESIHRGRPRSGKFMPLVCHSLTSQGDLTVSL